MSISISAKCYQEKKERVQNKDGKRYQNLSKKEKKVAICLWTLQKSHWRWKQNLVEYSKYYIMRKIILL